MLTISQITTWPEPQPFSLGHCGSLLCPCPWPAPLVLVRLHSDCVHFLPKVPAGPLLPIQFHLPPIFSALVVPTVLAPNISCCISQDHCPNYFSAWSGPQTAAEATHSLCASSKVSPEQSSFLSYLLFKGCSLPPCHCRPLLFPSITLCEV